VSDAFSLNRFADITLYIVRAEYTQKQSIAEAEKLQTSGKFNNMYFVFNASDIKKANYQYGYDYGEKEKTDKNKI